MKKLLTLLLLLLCTGCTALPAEERSFAVALGVSGEHGAWTVYARIPTYQTGGGYATVTGEGDTLAHALAALDAASPMQLHLGQLRLLVFTAEVARSADFPALLDGLSGRHDLRAAATVAVTEEGMGALMDALKPASGSRLSKSLDLLIRTRTEQGMILPSTLADVMRMGQRQQAALADVGLDGGDVRLSGCWPMSADGRVSRPFTQEETQLLALMTGRLRQGTLSLESCTLRLTDADAAAQVEPGLAGASLWLEMRCAELPLTQEALEATAAQACLSLLERLSAMGCDLLGLGGQAMKGVHDMEGWRALDWPARYGAMRWSVSVGVRGGVGE